MHGSMGAGDLLSEKIAGYGDVAVETDGLLNQKIY